MLSRYLFRRDSALSEATTAVNSPGVTTPNTPGVDIKGSVRYTGPKRTFSLVRGNGKKDVLRLVDKPVNSLDKATGGKIKADMPDALADCLVDFIQLSSLLPPTPIFDDTETQPVASPLATSHPVNALGPGQEQWASLEVDTRQFLSSVVPSWTTEDPPQMQSTEDPLHKQYRKPKFTTIIKAFIKRSGKGFVIRLLHRTKTGFDEVADIHMLGFGKVELEDTQRFPPSELQGNFQSSAVEIGYSHSTWPSSTSTIPRNVSDIPQYSFARPLNESESSASMTDTWSLGNLSEGSVSNISGTRSSLDDGLGEDLGKRQSPAQGQQGTQRRSKGQSSGGYGQKVYDDDGKTSDEESEFHFPKIESD
jgi:hypothetical protein